MRKLLDERIVVIDGAMGTSLQQFPLTEEDFRGTEFADHGKGLYTNISELIFMEKKNTQI